MPIREYDFKRGYKPEVERVKDCLSECFGVEPAVEGGRCKLSYGAIKELNVGIEGKKLTVDTVSNPDPSTEEAQDTIRRFNTFLESVTGLNSKQRRNRMKKEATKES